MIVATPTARTTRAVNTATSPAAVPTTTLRTPARPADVAAELALDSFERTAAATNASTTVLMSKTATTAAAPGYPAGSVTSSSARAQGAFFYKMAAPPSRGASGIQGTGRLPEVVFDPNRNHVEGLPRSVQASLPKTAGSHVEYYGNVYRAGAGAPSATLNALTNFRTGPLDRPSAYMGGHSSPEDVEVDAGLSTDRVYDARGNATFTTESDMTGGPGTKVYAVGGIAPDRFLYDVADPTKVLAKGDAAVLSNLDKQKMVPNFGFRPFWRVSEPGADNRWKNPEVNAGNNRYFYPGQAFHMEIATTGKKPENLSLNISTDGTPGTTVSYPIQARGFTRNSTVSFKRVNSIDLFHIVNGNRVGTEAKAKDEFGPARAGVRATSIATTTTAAGAQWSSTNIRGESGAWSSMFGKNPPDLVRGSEWPDSAIAAYLRIFAANMVNGIETIDITPGKK